jgi:copper(I)-binding protein
MRYLFFLVLIWASEVVADQHLEVQAWGRATPPGAGSGAVYGTFINHGDTLLEVTEIRFPGAAHVMVHETVHVDGMARMRHGQLKLAPGEKVRLEPGGMHIMLMGLEYPLLEGCRYEFTLVWQDGSETRHRSTTGGFGQMQPPASDGRPCQ